MNLCNRYFFLLNYRSKFIKTSVDLDNKILKENVNEAVFCTCQFVNNSIKLL